MAQGKKWSSDLKMENDKTRGKKPVVKDEWDEDDELESVSDKLTSDLIRKLK